MQDLKGPKERNFKAALAHAVENRIPFFPEVGDPVIEKFEDLPTATIWLEENGLPTRNYNFHGSITTGEGSLEFIWVLASVSDLRFGFSSEIHGGGDDDENFYTLLIWTKE